MSFHVHFAFKGTYAFNINATDRDPGDILRYALTGINARFFRVDVNNGRVYIQSSLERQVRNP